MGFFDNKLYVNKMLVSKEHIEDGAMDAIRYYKDKLARDFGQQVIKAKGVGQFEDDEGDVKLELALYVLTPHELRQLIDLVKAGEID